MRDASSVRVQLDLAAAVVCRIADLRPMRPTRDTPNGAFLRVLVGEHAGKRATMSNYNDDEVVIELEGSTEFLPPDKLVVCE